MRVLVGALVGACVGGIVGVVVAKAFGLNARRVGLVGAFMPSPVLGAIVAGGITKK